MAVRVEMDHAALARIKRDVGERYAHRIRDRAKDLVSVGAPDPLGRPARGPHLRDTIEATEQGDGRFLIGSSERHARAQEVGGNPHRIPKKQLDYKLRFVVGGRTIAVWAVNHPGNPAQHYLGRAAEQIIS